MLRQLTAHASHARMQSSIPLRARQLSAQASHTSAHNAQNCMLKLELLNCRLAEVWQTSAQLFIKRKCAGSVCLPPSSRQCVMAICRHIWWQEEHASMQDCMESDFVELDTCVDVSIMNSSFRKGQLTKSGNHMPRTESCMCASAHC